MAIDTTKYDHESSVDYSVRLHKQLASDREHRAEIMSWVNDFNALRDKYNALCRDNAIIGAERDVAYNILRENSSNLSLSREQINKRLQQGRINAAHDFSARFPNVKVSD